jgi:phosphoglycolate phosphatase
MIKSVIFDLDGTLVTFNLDVKACRTEVIKYLTDQGFPRSLFSMTETAFDMLVKAKKYPKKGSRNPEFTKIEKTVFSIVESFELKAARTNEMFRGIPETLQALKDMNLKIALCTISGDKATSYVLERFNLAHFFDAVVTRDSVSDVKPNPAHLEAVLDALNVLPQEAVLVGDSTKDVACASLLNVIAVGVTTGLSSIEQLTKSGAHYIASSVDEIPSLILQLQKQASVSV